MKIIIQYSLLAACLFCTITATAQMSGNQVYDNSYSRNDYANYRGITAVIIRDSIMQVSADVLMNAKADSFVITLGLNQEASSIKDCNQAINKRINSFLQSLKGINIAEKDTYVDFITETKIYTYDVSGNTATQRLKGFEIKKNIIIKTSANATFDKIIELASDYQIYDVVKVDYIVADIQRIYSEMMQAASGIIKQKKETYLILSPVNLLPVPKITAETFYAVYPNAQYKAYQAFESSDVSASYTNNNFVKSEERKNKTFYYQKTDQSGYDLIINNSTPVVPVQFVLKIQMEYKLIRS